MQENSKTEYGSMVMLVNLTTDVIAVMELKEEWKWLHYVFQDICTEEASHLVECAEYQPLKNELTVFQFITNNSSVISSFCCVLCRR